MSYCGLQWMVFIQKLGNIQKFSPALEFTGFFAHRSITDYISLPCAWRGRGLLLPGDARWSYPSWGKMLQASEELAGCLHGSSCNSSQNLCGEHLDPPGPKAVSPWLAHTGTHRVYTSVRHPHAQRWMHYELPHYEGGTEGCVYYCFSSGPANPTHSEQICDLIRGFKKHLVISCLLKHMEEESKAAGIWGKFCLILTVTAHFHSTHTFLLQIILENVERIQSNSKTPQ